MYHIVKTERLEEKIFLLQISAPRIATSCGPGQFVIIKLNEKGERVPLTISDYDAKSGTITVVFQVLGATTEKLSKLRTGDELLSVTGPLGKVSKFVEEFEHIKNERIVFIAGGLGAAPVYPQAKWLFEKGVPADIIFGVKSKELMILENELTSVAKQIYITTDDGSYHRKGLVTDVLKDLVKEGKTYNYCVAIGPMMMMKHVCNLTKELNIETIVSLNPIMVDGTGMCGACRVTVGDEVKFACVDGPEFDGFLINFDEAIKRQKIYNTIEGREHLKVLEGNTHHGGCGNCEGDN